MSNNIDPIIQEKYKYDNNQKAKARCKEAVKMELDRINNYEQKAA